MKSANRIFVVAAFLCCWTVLRAAESVGEKNSSPTKPSIGGKTLFDDPIVARGKGLAIRQSQVDDMYAAFRANRSAAGETIPESLRPAVEADILDKLIATQLCLARAIEADKSKGQEIAREFIAEQMRQASSEESFNRQLRAVGMSPQEFRNQVAEQAIVKAVLDREIKAQKIVTEAEEKKFYDENPKLFEQPEMAHVAHILISTLDPDTSHELSAEQKAQKRELAEKVLARAKAGENFTKLVQQFSDDKNAKDRNGEYTIARNDQRFVLTPEFEGAAFSLGTNQISGLVVSSYGYHIIKALEKIPPKKADYAQVEAKIKETLLQEAVQKALPDYIDKLKKEAGVEIVRSEKTK